MKTPIVRVAALSLSPVLLIVSWFLLARGHHEPGGGFVGGLVAAAAIAFYGLVHGAEAARARLPMDPLRIAALGLVTALLSGVPAVLGGRPFLSAVWWDARLPAIGKAGTPVLFDTGVYLVVLGIGAAVLLEVLRGDER